MVENVFPQVCSSCGSAPMNPSENATTSSWVYAIGRIEPRFPKISVEKEYLQAVGRDNNSGLTGRQTFHAALSRPQNRYLARQLCWVMTIDGLETYILVPRDPVDLSLLIETLRPEPQPGDLDCVIGVLGPSAGPDVCNGLVVPLVGFDQIYSFDRDSLIKAIPKPEKNLKGFTPAAEELFERIMHLADNAGATDEHRALNYLAMRYPRVYEATAEAFARNESLTSVDVRLSPLSGTRKAVEVIFTYTHRNTDVSSKQSVRVDVTEQFPFLLRKLSPYFDH
jgi:hypothetical protein